MITFSSSNPEEVTNTIYLQAALIVRGEKGRRGFLWFVLTKDRGPEPVLQRVNKAPHGGQANRYMPDASKNKISKLSVVGASRRQQLCACIRLLVGLPAFLPVCLCLPCPVHLSATLLLCERRCSLTFVQHVFLVCGGLCALINLY